MKSTYKQKVKTSRILHFVVTLFLAVCFISHASAKSNYFPNTSNGTEIKADFQQQSAETVVTVSGRILDENGAPVVGASVKESKTPSKGAVTNLDGKFELKVTKGSTLLVSSVGFLSRTIEVKNDAVLNVVLKEDTKALQEVVVTGYQTVKKQSMAGSISTIKATDLVLNGTQTLEQSLQGQLSGVNVMNQSGLVGTRQTIRVRGTSTLLGNREPVWVVDGIIQEDPLPFNTNSLASLGDNMSAIRNFVGGAISWLNPEDIENLTVLKDASATAIYGVKAANGVIVITTKKGQQGRLSLTYSGGISTSQKMSYDRLELMNSMERVAISREAFERGALVSSEPTVGYLKYAFDYDRKKITFDEFNAQVKRIEMLNTDWFDLLFRNPISHNHTIGISGGDNRTTYRASFGYNNAQNTAIGNDQSSYFGNMNVSAKFWNRLSLSLGISGNLSKTNGFVGIDPFSYANNTSRTIPLRDENGDLFYYLRNGYSFNIMNELNQSGNKNTKASLASNANLRLTLAKGLVVSSLFGFNFSNTHGETWRTERSWYIATYRQYDFGLYGPGDKEYDNSALPYGGLLNMSTNRNQNFTWRNQIEFTKILNEKHSVTAMAGTEMRSNKYDGFSQENWGYMPDRGKRFTDLPVTYRNGMENNLRRSVPTIIDRTANFVSYYGNVSYMFDERYAVNASIRTDASNRFGQDRSARYQPVWSVGMRWNVMNEPWMENQTFMNALSLRASYGYQGNVVESIGPDLIASLQDIDKYGDFKMYISRLPSPDLKWEKNKSVNMGLDFGFFKNRFTGSFEYYDKLTQDMIVNRAVPLENGVRTMPINGGSMRNYGWDLNVNVTPVRTEDFGLTLGLSTGKVYNSVNSDLAPSGSWGSAVTGGLYKQGYPVSSIWAFKFAGLNPQTGAPMLDLTGSKTDLGTQDVTSYMVHVGKLQPDFTAGLNLNVRYKMFTLNSNFYLSTGNKQFLSSPYANQNVFPAEDQNLSSELNNRWRKPGDELTTTIPSLPHYTTNKIMFPFQDALSYLYPYMGWGYSDARVVDASFLRCNNLNLTCQLPGKLISSFAQSMSLSFSMSNVFQIVSKDYKGRDPEVARGQQPMTKNYTLRLSASF